MAAGDFYDYPDEDFQDQASHDGAYQVDQDMDADGVKEYTLPPLATDYHDSTTDASIEDDEYDGHMFSLPSTPTTYTSPRTESFVSRVSSIPIIQDGVQNAQKAMEGHMLGRLAGRALWSLYERARPYVEQNQTKWQTQIELANDLGHRSLDVIEQRFPLIMNGSSDDLKMAPQLVVGEIRGRISQAMRQLQAPATIGLVMDNLEAVLDQYFPGEDDDMDGDILVDPKDSRRIHIDDDDNNSKEGGQEPSYHHIHRMYRIANSLSSRIARRIAHQIQADTDVSVSAWLAGHSQQVFGHLEHFKSQLPEPIQQHLVAPLIQVAQQEMDIIRLEIEKPGLTPVERAKNVLAVSQDRVVMPLLQRSVQSMRSQVVLYRSLAQENKAHVMNELSSKVPILANMVPMSAFASHHYKSSQQSEMQAQLEEKAY